MKTRLAVLMALALSLPAAAQPDPRAWRFRETEEGVHLRYGGPESDDVLATFVCYKGSNSVELYLVFQSEPTDTEDRTGPYIVRLTLASGSILLTTGAAIHDDHDGEGLIVTYQARTEDPILQAMARSGRFSASAFDEILRPPPFRKADMARFLEACRKGHRR